MKSYDKSLTRLVFILTKLSNNELPTIKELAQEFNVGIRTIQRDIYERLIYFPIEKDGQSRLKFIDGFTLNKCNLQNDEMLLVYLAMSQVKTVHKKFENTIDHVFSKLLSPGYNTPYFIKSKSFEQIDFKSKLLKDIEFAIQNNQLCNITLTHKTLLVKPYKIVSFDGIWYLFARDTINSKIKTFMISQIEKFQNTREKFTLETDIEQVLSNVHSAWFEDGNSFEVKIKVNKKVAHYFQARNIFPTQEIVAINDDGSLDIVFQVSHIEDIDNIIKSWFPDITIISPDSYREHFKKEIQEYLLNL